MLNVGSGVSASYGTKSGFEKVPEVLVSSDSDTTEYAVIVEKQSQKLYLYSFDGSNQKKIDFNTSTGEVVGAKTREGDKKTPEGIYFFIKEYPKRDLAPIYGSRAFPMDYPNLLDRIAERDGNAIWLHGSNKSLKPRDSNGCVVLVNRDINRLAEFIELNRTPIIVVDKLSYVPVGSVANARKSIIRFISRWKQSLERGTYHEYLMYYDADYLPIISWWPDWKRVKKAQRISSEPISVDLKKIMILRHKGVYVALFDQVVRFSDKEEYAGTRKLFLKDEGNTYKIIGDTYQVLPKRKKSIKPGNPLVAAARGLKNTPKVAVNKRVKKILKKDREVQKMIAAWLRAWSSRDIKKYGSYYSKKFKSQGGASLDSWLKYKNRINRKYKYIRVTEKNLKVKKGAKRSVATFTQRYESSAFKTVGTKKLILIRENGRWKIYREIWKKS
jgi:murein L,D-transpeptidase YafK